MAVYGSLRDTMFELFVALCVEAIANQETAPTKLAREYWIGKQMGYEETATELGFDANEIYTEADNRYVALVNDVGVSSIISTLHMTTGYFDITEYLAAEI